MSEEKKPEAYPSIERSLDKIVDKLEGNTDDTYEESVPSVEKSLWKIADLFEPGSKEDGDDEGGEGGVFNVQLERTETNPDGHYVTTYSLNKTWNEIHDAFLTRPVLVHSQVYGIGIITNVAELVNNNVTEYLIMTTIPDPWGGVFTFTVSDPDSYPEITMS